MRNSKALIGGLLALVLVACGGAQGSDVVKSDTAASARVQAAAAPVGQGDSRFLQHFDKNGDGKVEVSELPPKMQARLASADTNKDGVLSTEELQANRAEHRKAKFAREDKNGDGAIESSEVSPEKWARIQVADANKDGKVTEAELDQAIANKTLPAMEGHRHHGKGHSPEAMIKRFDKNGDGKIQQAEVPADKSAWFTRVDANKDGVVTKDEIEAAHARHEQHDASATDARAK